jgi:hypothetical protein
LIIARVSIIYVSLVYEMACLPAIIFLFSPMMYVISAGYSHKTIQRVAICSMLYTIYYFMGCVCVRAHACLTKNLHCVGHGVWQNTGGSCRKSDSAGPMSDRSWSDFTYSGSLTQEHVIWLCTLINWYLIFFCHW